MKKIKSVPILFVMIFMLLTTTVFAKNITQDSRSVTLTTNKTEYTKDEEIKVDLTITNDNPVTIANVLLETYTPKGYVLDQNSVDKKTIDNLESGDTATISVTYIHEVDTPAEPDTNEVDTPVAPDTDEVDTPVAPDTDEVDTPATPDTDEVDTPAEPDTDEVDTPVEPDADKADTTTVPDTDEVDTTAVPDTVDNTNILMNVFFFVTSLLVFLIPIKKKQGRKLLSLLLCIGIIGTTISCTELKALAKEETTIETTIDTTIDATTETTAEATVAATAEIKNIEIEQMVLVDGEEIVVKGSVKYEEVIEENTDSEIIAPEEDKDTDGDGLSDDEEIQLGTDPLVPQDVFNVTKDSDEEDVVKASVDIDLKGEQVKSLSVSKVDNKTFFPEDMPGYLGSAYDLSVDGTFEDATLKFEFDNALVGSEKFDPTIYRINEDLQKLEAMETTIEGNIASAKTTSAAKYILVNRTVYEDSFTWTDIWEVNNYEGVEMILVIDDSGSMISNDSQNQRLAVAQNLVNKLPQNSKIGIIAFDSYVNTLTELTSDKATANSFLTTGYFGSSGGTRMYNGIEMGISLYQAKEDNILKAMVVLSDGATSDDYKYDEIVSLANNNNVKIHSVGLGDFKSNLESLSGQTGGKFYQASHADELNAIYDDINVKIDIETDTDKDGISDYYEDNMVIFSGVKFNLDKNNPDTDGDGLLDGEEITELTYEYNADKTRVKVTGKMVSNPTEVDSDFDGIHDMDDKQPLNNKF